MSPAKLEGFFLKVPRLDIGATCNLTEFLNWDCERKQMGNEKYMQAI